jgi:hypothetical protein
MRHTFYRRLQPGVYVPKSGMNSDPQFGTIGRLDM